MRKYQSNKNQTKDISHDLWGGLVPKMTAGYDHFLDQDS